MDTSAAVLPPPQAAEAWPALYLERELLGEFWHIRSPGLLLVQGHDHEVLEQLPLLVLHELPVKGWVSRSVLQA